MTDLVILVIKSRVPMAKQKKSRLDARERRILDAASQLFVRFGYDKTTVREIASTAGVSKGTIYLHFDSKKELFEALLVREMNRFSESWLEYIEADPRGGTMGGIYKNILLAQHSSELMKAIYRQDAQIFGSYLRTDDHLFATMQAQSMRAEFIEAMQEAGAVRCDLEPKVMAHVMDIIGYGLASIAEIKNPATFPPIEQTIELIADIMDRALTPEGGADSEAGKKVVRKVMAGAREYLDHQTADEDGDDEA